LPSRPGAPGGQDGVFRDLDRRSHDDGRAGLRRRLGMLLGLLGNRMRFGPRSRRHCVPAHERPQQVRWGVHRGLLSADRCQSAVRLRAQWAGELHVQHLRSLQRAHLSGASARVFDLLRRRRPGHERSLRRLRGLYCGSDPRRVSISGRCRRGREQRRWRGREQRRSRRRGVEWRNRRRFHRRFR
jgi:hypothetical protein